MYVKCVEKCLQRLKVQSKKGQVDKVVSLGLARQDLEQNLIVTVWYYHAIQGEPRLEISIIGRATQKT